jgi:hypothetical protein
MESSTPRTPAPPEPPEPPEAYEAPAVAWEEPYDPVGLTASCAKWDGHPACDVLWFR